MDEENSIYNNENTIKSCIMVLILNLLDGRKSQITVVMLLILYLHPSIKLKIYNMTVDVHVSRSENLILNVSRSTDVNTKYQQQQTNKQFKFIQVSISAYY